MTRSGTKRPSIAPPGFICPLIGFWRRQRGQYDRGTLVCFYRAWRHDPSSISLIRYLRFRRDLGRVAPIRLLRPLLGSWSGLDRRTQRMVLNLAMADARLDVMAALPSEDLIEHTSNTPAAAALLQQRGIVLPDRDRMLAELSMRQLSWHDAFTRHLEAYRGNICVVGNAGTSQGRGQGGQIDQHGLVVRFNRFMSDSQSGASVAEDIGQRIDAWVMAPDLKPPFLDAVKSVEWVILSGPDVRYQLGDWAQVIPLLQAGKKVLTVPLSVWRSLVRELKAPPSAGLLCLAWFIDLLGTPEGISVAGFQRVAQPGAPYHFAIPGHKASPRHNWAGERILLSRWQVRGLRFID